MSQFNPWLDLYLAQDAEDVALDSTEWEKAVCYPLADTSVLCTMADKVRKILGFAPMFTGPDSELDLGGWYNFYIYVPEHDTVSDIEFVVENPADINSDGQSYYIPLTDEERKQVFKRLNEMSIKQVGFSCNRLLDILREKV